MSLTEKAGNRFSLKYFEDMFAKISKNGEPEDDKYYLSEEYGPYNYSGTPRRKVDFAVLAPLIEVGGKVRLLFEVRAMNMRRQPGEVCFPGGRIEPGESPDACAVRETVEEIGAKKKNIKVIGRVGKIYTLYNEPVNVVLGELKGIPDGGFPVNPAEVHEVFTVPFEYFCEKGPKDSYNYEGYYIWGMTARSVNRLVKMCMAMEKKG